MFVLVQGLVLTSASASTSATTSSRIVSVVYSVVEARGMYVILASLRLGQKIPSPYIGYILKILENICPYDIRMHNYKARVFSRRMLYDSLNSHVIVCRPPHHVLLCIMWCTCMYVCT